MYLPGFRLTVNVEDPPFWITVPCLLTLAPCSDRPWGMGEGFENFNVTAPAFAVAVVVLNLRAPLGLAERDTVEEAPAGAGVVAGAAELDVALLLELLLLLLLPQAARAEMAKATSAMAASLMLVTSSDGLTINRR